MLWPLSLAADANVGHIDMSYCICSTAINLEIMLD